jgi:hypothetical protein
MVLLLYHPLLLPSFSSPLPFLLLFSWRKRSLKKKEKILVSNFSSCFWLLGPDLIKFLVLRAGANVEVCINGHFGSLKLLQMYKSTWSSNIKKENLHWFSFFSLLQPETALVRSPLQNFAPLEFKTNSALVISLKLEYFKPSSLPNKNESLTPFVFFLFVSREEIQRERRQTTQHERTNGRTSSLRP